MPTEIIQDSPTVENDSTPLTHAFSFAFEVEGSKCPHGSDITIEAKKKALLERLAKMEKDGTLEQAIGSPWDTYET